MRRTHKPSATLEHSYPLKSGQTLISVKLPFHTTTTPETTLKTQGTPGSRSPIHVSDTLFSLLIIIRCTGYHATEHLSTWLPTQHQGSSGVPEKPDKSCHLTQGQKPFLQPLHKGKKGYIGITIYNTLRINSQSPLLQSSSARKMIVLQFPREFFVNPGREIPLIFQ